ncbi:MAG: hypothetical protein EB084_07440 [Proteobacteria bacterium]|nr:hypothetical protein [Pseudomonadota bacterium]
MSRDAVSQASQIVKSMAAKSKPLQKAALLLNALEPGLTLEVARELGEREVKNVLAELDRLPKSSVESVAIINEFFCIHRLWTTVGGPLTDADQILEALERWARRNPRRLARLLKESWLAPRG